MITKIIKVEPGQHSSLTVVDIAVPLPPYWQFYSAADSIVYKYFLWGKIPRTGFCRQSLFTLYSVKQKCTHYTCTLCWQLPTARNWRWKACCIHSRSWCSYSWIKKVIMDLSLRNSECIKWSEDYLGITVCPIVSYTELRYNSWEENQKILSFKNCLQRNLLNRISVFKWSHTSCDQ
jgi:hypothetical protein